MDHPIFKSQIITEINDVKWNEYGFNEYIWEVFRYLLFLIIFTTNIYVTRYSAEMSDNKQIVLCILDGVLLLYVLYYWIEEFT